MKPLPIGIVGGAGPMAGCALLERLFRLSIEKYGCFQDADFPKVILLSFPFSEMLASEFEEQQVKKELQACLDELRKCGASVLAIACNTLHAFLDDNASDLVHMLESVADRLSGEAPLVLCTSTSRRFGVHKKYFPCIYPEKGVQQQVDGIIEKTLKGFDMSRELADLLRNERRKCVLGCTELSLYADRFQECIDPLTVVAEEILNISFRRKK